MRTIGGNSAQGCMVANGDCMTARGGCMRISGGCMGLWGLEGVVWGPVAAGITSLHFICRCNLVALAYL